MRLFNRRPRDLVTIEEYAAHRGVSTDTIYRYIRQGKIQRHKDGIDQVRADLMLDNPDKNRKLQMFVARCKNWVQKRRYSIIVTVLLLALLIPTPAVLAEYHRRGQALAALEAENAELRATRDELLGLSDKYAGLMDVSEALGLDVEEAVAELEKVNPNVTIPELTLLALLDRSSYFADWIAQEVGADRDKLEAYITQAERTPNCWPVKGTVTSEYGWRYVKRGSSLSRVLGYVGNRWHPGIDIAAKAGTKVEATAAGEVTWTGERESYGNLVIVDHGTYQTYYAHLQRITVTEGQKVARGDRVGTVGSTGTSTGPHLHYEVRVHGEPVNPRRYLP